MVQLSEKFPLRRFAQVRPSRNAVINGRPLRCRADNSAVVDVYRPPCASRRQRLCSSVLPNRSSPSSQTRPRWGPHQNGSAQSLRKAVKHSLKAIKAVASTRTTTYCGSVFSPQSFIPHPLHPFQHRFVAHPVVESFHKQWKGQWSWPWCGDV